MSRTIMKEAPAKSTADTLKAIKPGETYPRDVIITESDGTIVKFLLESYFVGMYCAVYINGDLCQQTGDHNNKSFVARLKKDIQKALKRDATIEFGAVFPVKKDMK